MLVEFPSPYSIGTCIDVHGTTINLSRSECAIRGMAPIRKGDYLRLLIFPAAGQPPIGNTLAPVRWAVDGHFGVVFIKIALKDAERLETYLSMTGTSSSSRWS